MRTHGMKPRESMSLVSMTTTGVDFGLFIIYPLHLGCMIITLWQAWFLNTIWSCELNNIPKLIQFYTEIKLHAPPTLELCLVYMKQQDPTFNKIDTLTWLICTMTNFRFQSLRSLFHATRGKCKRPLYIYTGPVEIYGMSLRWYPQVQLT